MIESEIPVAMVCHAPGILRDVRGSNGEPIVKGRDVTGFSDAEDEELDLAQHLLFSLENMLKQNGANYIRSEANWNANVVESARS